jgi:hypothetical protein
MDNRKDIMSSKKNWLVELMDITGNERDDFLKFVSDHDKKKQNKPVSLEFAVVSIFYWRNKSNQYTMNMRVSNCFYHYGNDTLC